MIGWIGPSWRGWVSQTRGSLGFSALYRSASIKVIISGRMGERFALERYVREGYPLALYLFLFFAKAMAHFLCRRSAGLRGIELSIQVEAELLDSEYADDTALYVQDDLAMLERVWLSLEIFCLMAGKKIN